MTNTTHNQPEKIYKTHPPKTIILNGEEVCEQCGQHPLDHMNSSISEEGNHMVGNA